jgi:hypothetical protein
MVLSCFEKYYCSRIDCLRPLLTEFDTVLQLRQHELELIKPFTQTNSDLDVELKLAAWEIVRLLLPDHRCLSRVIPFQVRVRVCVAHVFNKNFNFSAKKQNSF